MEAGPQLLQFLILALLELDPVLQLLQPVFQLLNLFLGSKKTRVDYLREEGCLGAHVQLLPALSWGDLPVDGVGLDKAQPA